MNINTLVKKLEEDYCWAVSGGGENCKEAKEISEILYVINVLQNNIDSLESSLRDVEDDRDKYKTVLEYIAGWNSELFNFDTPFEMRKAAERTLEND